MTLEEFRRNWIASAESSQPASPPPSSQRLSFRPPDDLDLVPRLVFREVFTPPPAEKRSRPRIRQWTVRMAWTALGLVCIAATGIGMAKAFEYAPTYIDTYLAELN